MRKIVIPIVVVLIIVLLFIFIKPSLLGSKGELFVSSSSPATVFVNNENYGETTVQKKLSSGEYAVKIVSDSLPSSPSWEQSIPITKNTRSIIQLFFGANDNETAWNKLYYTSADKDSTELSINSVPDAVQVYIDGTLKGSTPLSLNDVAKGDHAVSFVRENYPDYTITITLAKGYLLNMLVKLPVSQSSESTQTSSSGNQTAKLTITIVSPETGWLRVRKEPSKSSEELAKVNNNETYSVVEEDNGWIKIEYKAGEFGWISKEYTKEVE